MAKKANYKVDSFGLGQGILTFVLILLTIFFAAPVLLLLTEALRVWA